MIKGQHQKQQEPCRTNHHHHPKMKPIIYDDQAASWSRCNHLTGKIKLVLNILLGEINIVRVKETPLNVGLEVEELGM